MRRLIFIMLSLFALPAMAQMRSATITASGLTCSMCSKAIYKALEKVPFVKEVQPDVEESKYMVTFKEGSSVSIDDLKRAVQNAGFSVASMQVTASFDNVEVYNDAHVSIAGSSLHFLNVSRQRLEGDKTFTILDKDFLPAKQRKAYARYTSMACFETGMMATCCPDKGAKQGRIYHVTL